jgi:hypothetical protein
MLPLNRTLRIEGQVVAWFFSELVLHINSGSRRQSTWAGDAVNGLPDGACGISGVGEDPTNRSTRNVRLIRVAAANHSPRASADSF